MNRSVGILGGGVIGLTAGIALLERGMPVTLYTSQLAPDTVSGVAASIWEPFLAGTPSRLTPEAVARMERWSTAALARYQDMVGDAWGVYWAENHEFYEKPQSFWFLPLLPGVREWPAARLRGGYAYGVSMRTLVVETPVFMPALVRAFEAHGGRIERRSLSSRAEINALPHETLINCLGLGARDLFEQEIPEADRTYAVKGQLVLLQPDPDLQYALNFQVGGEDRYFFPRHDALVLGGTYEAHAASAAPDDAVTRMLLEQHMQFIANAGRAMGFAPPKIAPERYVRAIAGLRPFRPAGPRLELERSGGKRIIHNYGHGGSGITFAWGCAEEASGLALAA